MNLVLVVLTAPTSEAGTAISPHILSDILWANADPADGLEHINVRAGADPGSHIIGLFLLPADPDAAIDRAVRVCHRAIQVAPALTGWTVSRRIHEHIPTASHGPAGD